MVVSGKFRYYGNPRSGTGTGAPFALAGCLYTAADDAVDDVSLRSIAQPLT
jgi:hypothetical protein